MMGMKVELSKRKPLICIHLHLSCVSWVTQAVCPQTAPSPKRSTTVPQRLQARLL